MTITHAPVVDRSPRAATRDTAIDLVRAGCVVAVVVLHALMVGVTVVDGAPVFDNASAGTDWIVPLSWMLQVMPLFFVIGGFSGYTAYQRRRAAGGTATAFVAARLHRLLLPALVTVAVVGVALAALASAGVAPELVATAGFRYGQPLWFLGVFLLGQALLPALAAAHRRAPLATIGVLAVAAVVVDVARAGSGIDAVGFLNLAFVWLTLQQLGFFVADGTVAALRRGTRLTVLGVAVIALLAAFAGGVYSPDLIENINPPTTALLIVGIAHTSVLSLLHAPLERWSLRPGVRVATDFVTRRAMTIYLWHMPVLLAMAGGVALWALATGVAPPEPSSADWWWSRPVWLAAAVALTAAIAVPLGRVEAATTPAPTRSARRVALGSTLGILAIVLLLAAGTSPATAAIAVALMVMALRFGRPQRNSVRKIRPEQVK